MIDPFSCLSIATAIAQFVDFGVEVIQKTREIERTKVTLKEISRLKQDATRLKGLHLAVQNTTLKSADSLGTEEHAFNAVAEQCGKFADEVLALLREFEVPENPSGLQRFKAAVKAQLKSGRIERCTQQLMVAKVDLCTHLLHSFSMSQPHLFRRLTLTSSAPQNR